MSAKTVAVFWEIHVIRPWYRVWWFYLSAWARLW